MTLAGHHVYSEFHGAKFKFQVQVLHAGRDRAGGRVTTSKSELLPVLSSQISGFKAACPGPSHAVMARVTARPSANWALLMMTFVSKISAIRSYTYDNYKNVIYL